MYRISPSIIIIFFLSVFFTKAQVKNDSISELATPKEIIGTVVDAENDAPLPYASIIAKNKRKGVISNESGDFLFNISALKLSDTIQFQYIGYKTLEVSIEELLKVSTIKLSEEIFEMNEVLILSHIPDPESIVKKVLKNKDLNYKNQTSKNQIFIRERYNTNIHKFAMEYKKSTIEGLDKEMIKSFEKNIPKHATSYTDFLGYLYSFPNEEDDKLELKVDPIKMVSLKEQDIAELNKIQKLFDSLFKSTDESEYWKIKSGIFGEKIDFSDDEEMKDSEVDSLEKDTRKTKYFKQGVKFKLRYTSFENKKAWEFLYKTGRYNYSIEGMTYVNEEDAYIIDFTPKKDGKFEGRMYISVKTSALIRADYKYAPNKIGRDIHLLGIGFTETEFAGSIFFEKINDTYNLKYFSKKDINEVSLNRKFSLIKKKNKLLFDKNLNEIKARLRFIASNESSVEFMVVQNEHISKSSFQNFNEKDRMNVIYVDQFDESLWKEYDIIEPTKQMKSYKKSKK